MMNFSIPYLYIRDPKTSQNSGIRALSSLLREECGPVEYDISCICRNDLSLKLRFIGILVIKFSCADLA